MIRNIDVGQLRTFLCVAEHRNMTHAANLRNLTQSAVSQQIKRLEEMLCRDLVVRTRTGVELTKSGLELLPLARETVERNDTLVATVFGTVVQSDIRLGVPQDVVASLLPKALKHFHKNYPEVNVTLVSDSTKNLIKMVDNRQVDLALTTDTTKVAEALLIRKIQLVWIGAKKGTALNKLPLPVAVGHKDCTFRQATSRVLATKNIAWRPVTQVGSLEPVYATLLADIAVAPFMLGTNPVGTELISKGLPALPSFYLHLRKSEQSSSVVAERLTKVLIEFMSAVEC